MTQRDDAARMVSYDSLESNELKRQISSVREADERAPADEHYAGETLSAASSEASTPDADAECGGRPTLMGIAPVELGDEPEHASGSHSSTEHRTHEQTSAEPETSTVRPAHWLLSVGVDDAAPDRQDGVELDAPDEAASVAPETASAPKVQSAPSAPEQTDSIAAESSKDQQDDSGSAHADDHAVSPQQPAPISANAPAEPPAPDAVQISMLMPTPPHAPLPEEGDSEWLDLSTRWLVTSAPRSEQPIVDENEVTGAHWAERLSARVGARGEAHSSAPPPPPQSTKLPGTRRATMGYGRAETHAAPSSFDAVGHQRQWAAAARRHATLAGISPLPEDPNSWPSASDAARSGRAGETNPWREEPSYSDAPPPPAHRPSAAAGYPAPVGTVAPWAATMSPYALQPTAAMMPAYAPASWNGGVAGPPPWAAQPNYGVPQHLPPAATYAASNRRATRTMDYAMPANAGSSMRPLRGAQHNASEINFERLKGMANTWFMTVGKLALAAMALHFSGLAKPLLANFGYTPAPAVASTGAAQSAVRTAVPTAASIAPSVIPEGLSPESAAEPAPRRVPSKRERRATEASTLRHSGTPAQKAKPKPSARAKAVRSAPAEAPAAVAAPRTALAAGAAAAPQGESTPQPTAATPARVERAREATLRINSRPWSEIYVDGTPVGHTPKLELRVSAGSHRIRLVNQELGLSKTFEVKAAAGETVSHVELFVD